MDGLGVVLGGGRGGTAEKTVPADHGFPGTRQNVTVPAVSRGYPGNVGLHLVERLSPSVVGRAFVLRLSMRPSASGPMTTGPKLLSPSIDALVFGRNDFHLWE